MNIEKFTSDFGHNLRAKDLIKFFSGVDDWVKYDDVFNFSIEEAKKRRIKNKNQIINGKPKETKRNIFFFIKIGYLLADPKKGLKRNPDFVPLNQR